MKVEDIKKVAILGTGLMARGIVQEFAQAGYDTYMIGRSVESIEKAFFGILDNLEYLKLKSLITELEYNSAVSKIYTTHILNEIPSDVDLVIESVVEDLEIKRNLFEKVEAICSNQTIFTSNTSSFTPTLLANCLKNPGRFLNTHYFNPPQLVPLVELIKGEKTEDMYVSLMYELYVKLGKKPVVLKKEIPGFIANRLQIALLREALHIVESGAADASDIDTVIKNSIGRRWAAAGVFEVCDLGGLDVFTKIAAILQPELCSEIKISKLLEEKLTSGKIGVKNGQGFYDWTPEKIKLVKEKIFNEFSTQKLQ